MRRIEKKQEEHKIEFFSKLPFCQHKTTRQLRRIMRSFEYEACIMNQVIYRQGEPASNVYVVAAGDFETLRTNKVNQNAFIKKQALPSNVKTLLGPKKVLSPDTEFTGYRPEHAKLRGKEMRVAVLGLHQMFGHEDVLNRRNYTTTVKCTSNNAAVFWCKAEDFLVRMKNDEKALRTLQEVCT